MIYVDTLKTFYTYKKSSRQPVDLDDRFVERQISIERYHHKQDI